MAAEARFTNWDLTAWSGLLHQEFVETVGRLPRMTIARDLNDANSKTIPILARQTAAEVTALTDRTGADGTTQTDVNLQHQNSLEVSDEISWETEIQVPWSIVSERARRMGRDVGNAYLERFIRYVAGATPTSNPDHLIQDDNLANTVSVGTAATACRDAIIATNTLFRVQNMPRGPENNFIMMADHLFNALFTLGEVVRKDFGNVGGVRTFGGGEYVYGDFTVIPVSTAWATNHSFNSLTPAKYQTDLTLATSTGTNVWAIAWNRWGLAQGFTKMSPTPMVIQTPVWLPWKKSWFCNVAMIWDIIALFVDDSVDRNVGIATWAEA